MEGRAVAFARGCMRNTRKETAKETQAYVKVSPTKPLLLSWKHRRAASMHSDQQQRRTLGCGAISPPFSEAYVC